MPATPDHPRGQRKLAEFLRTQAEARPSSPEPEDDELGANWHRTREYRTLLLWARQVARADEE